MVAPKEDNCSASAESFQIERVADLFEKSLHEEDDVHLSVFVSAYEELNKFIGMLGTIFQFVQSDVRAKTTCLRQLMVTNPEEYKTVHNMFQTELESRTFKGTKSLLALHRALQFIVSFMSDIAIVENKHSMAELCRRSYNSTLAKHHNWAIRKAVGLASYTLPNRQQLILSIVEEDPDEEYVKEVINNVVTHGNKVYERVLVFYDTHDLHGLI